jgi:CubicO group peptidase (beta-lactamase class C family)
MIRRRLALRSLLWVVGIASAGFDGPVRAAPSSATNLEQCRRIGLQACPVPFDAVLPAPKDMLLWTQDQRVVGFRNTYRQYPADVFRADPANVHSLPSSDFEMPPPHYTMSGRRLGLQDYLRHQSVTGLLVVKGGLIVYEHYGRGNTRSTLWTSRSVAKSVVSILVGIAIKDGFISSVDDPVTMYLPELKQTAWEGVTLRNLLQHTSGVSWNEDYKDPQSDFARLTHCEAGAQPYDCVFELIRSVRRIPDVKPGQVWSYNTGGAWLVGRVLERATGTTIAHYLETRLWRPFGMESDGVWQALRAGEVDMGGHGFNATLRDWARFGVFVANGGHLSGGESLLPTDWLAQSTQWTKAKGSVSASSPDGQYGFQWWHLGVAPEHGGNDRVKATTDHTLWAEGIYGQTIAVNPRSNLVMVQWSTWKEAAMTEPFYDEQALFFHAIDESLGGAADR